ncbi:hypothetical protein HYU96_00070 [Candidatus Daviesbacteria bacterium]|nr:hypothetical protein [Candidatus Daviesbacteria bacterium]
MIITKTHQDLKDVLLEPQAPGAKEAYFILPAENQNITVIMSGNNGREFNKTHGHFHKAEVVEIFQCLYGQGLLIMQRNDEMGEAKEFKVVTLSAGKQITVPAGFAHCAVNTGKNFLVILDNASSSPQALSYKLIKQKHGFAYYVVEKKGEIAFEQNPNYAVHPQISTE